MASSNAQMSAEDICRRQCNEYVLSNCKEGDLLQFPRFGYSHWGVYVGNGKVIHRAGDPDDNGSSSGITIPSFLSSSGVEKGKAQIKESSFSEVVGKGFAFINNSWDKEERPLPVKEIVKRANGKIGTIGYNLLSKNCEHFANWCRYGVSFSEQVVNFFAGVGVVGLLSLVITAVRRVSN